MCCLGRGGAIDHWYVVSHLTLEIIAPQLFDYTRKRRRVSQGTRLIAATTATIAASTIVIVVTTHGGGR